MVKYCSNCGAEIPDEGMFCPNCGKEAVNVNDINRRNPSYDGKKPKTEKNNNINNIKNDNNKSNKSRFILILAIMLIIFSAFVLYSSRDYSGVNSEDNYNISYKGIYLSGKGIVDKQNSSFVNETIFDGIHYYYIDYYNVTLNDGEWYRLMISETEIENASTNPNYNVNAINTSTYEDLGYEYSVPFSIVYTNCSEIKNGTNITYAYSVSVCQASHYKYLSTEFLDSIIYPQEH